MPEQMPDIAPWLQLGFVGWLAWHLLTKQLPKMEERAEKRDGAYLASLEKEREGRKADREAIVGAVDELTDEVRRSNAGSGGFGHGGNGAHRGDRGSRG